MRRDDERYAAYAGILREELVPAMGCTEPIAIACAGAWARRALEKSPEGVRVTVSSNIVKNVKSAVVPNTGGRRGIAAAAAAGIVFGDPDAMLEVISRVTPQQQRELGSFLRDVPVDIRPAEGDVLFDILVEARAGDDRASAHITGCHTGLVRVEKNGRALLTAEAAPVDAQDPRRALLTVEGILDFADTCGVADVAEPLERQIACNTAIADAGLAGDWGANIGSVLLDMYGADLGIRARARAAAGSDARMSGCELPVIINSGSGNQGIAASVPVIEYAEGLGKTHEQLLRALTVSNLLTIHLKAGIGKLSAYCGAVSAGCSAGAGIAYLCGGGYEEVAHTLVNSLAIVSGIICDGAKSSCAAKIASAVDAGLLGWQMYQRGQQFYGGDGIVTKGVEATIENICRVGGPGMRQTDQEIIRIMTGN